MIKNYILLAVIFITGCSSMSAIEKDQKRNELDAMAKATIASLIEKDPQLKEEIEKNSAEFAKHLEGGFVKGYPSTYISKQGSKIHLIFNFISI